MKTNENFMMRTEIKKGINLWLIPERKFKGYRAGVFIHTPKCAEYATKNALIPLLLKQGSTGFPNRTAMHERLSECLGATVSAESTAHEADHIISFVLKGVADRYTDYISYPGDPDRVKPDTDKPFCDGLELLFDLVLNPIRPANGKYFDSAKKQLAERIEGEKNDKRAYAMRRCIAHMAKGHPASVPENGFAEELSALTAEQTLTRYDEVIANCPIDIIIVGSVRAEQATEAVKKAFSHLSDREEKRPVSSPIPARELSTVTESMSIAQGKLSVGYSLPAYEPGSREHAAMTVCNTVFGGSPASKLFMNVRERLSLAYYASSFYRREAGLVMANCGIECENFEKARDEIMAQFELLTAGEITENELMLAKKQLINQYTSVSDSLGAIMSFALGQIISGTGLTPEEQVKLISSVSAEEVKAVAKKIKPSLIYFLKGDEK